MPYFGQPVQEPFNCLGGATYFIHMHQPSDIIGTNPMLSRCKVYKISSHKVSVENISDIIFNQILVLIEFMLHDGN